MTTDAAEHSQNGSTSVKHIRLGTGLNIWRGVLNEEYLPQLKPWSRAVKVIREMQDDATIGSLLEAIKTPLLSSPFSIEEPPNASSRERQATELCRHSLFKMDDMEWREHVEEALDFIDYGFSISEKVVEKHRDGMLHLRSLIPIGQETLHRWGEVDELGRVNGFWQMSPTTGSKPLFAPIDKLVHLTFRSQKRNPQGESLLRSLYRPNYFKRNLEALEAIGAERDVGNTPVAELGEGFYSTEQIDALETGLAGLRADETSYVITPNGVKIHALGSGGKVYNIREMIRDWQHVIRQRFFADFLALGSESVGTQALAHEMTTFFSLALRSIQLRMLEAWQRQLIRWLLQLNGYNLGHRNGSNAVREPTLMWEKPGAPSIQALGQALSMLGGAGLITPDESIENRLRKELSLPPLQRKVSNAPSVGDAQRINTNNGKVPIIDEGLGDKRGPSPQVQKGLAQYLSDAPLSEEALMLIAMCNSPQPAPGPDMLSADDSNFNSNEITLISDMRTSTATVASYNIIMDNTEIGWITILRPETENLYIEALMIYEQYRGPRTILALRDALRRQYPNATTVSGYRITGVRQARPETIRRFLEEACFSISNSSDFSYTSVGSGRYYGLRGAVNDAIQRNYGFIRDDVTGQTVILSVLNPNYITIVHAAHPAPPNRHNAAAMLSNVAAAAKTARPDSRVVAEDEAGNVVARYEQSAEHTGAMIALYPPPAVAQRLALKNGIPSNDLHVTLAFLGNVADIKNPQQLKDIIGAVAASSQPLSGTYSGIGSFTLDSQGNFPVYASVDVSGLGAFRERAVTALEQNGISVNREHGFTPHTTLVYISKGAAIPRITIEPLPVQFNSVYVVLGGERFEFPLGAQEASHSAEDLLAAISTAVLSKAHRRS